MSKLEVVQIKISKINVALWLALVLVFGCKLDSVSTFICVGPL